MTESMQVLFLTEHPFWLEVLRDHSQFIRDSLAPNEQTLVSQIDAFYQLFDHALAEVRTVQVHYQEEATKRFRNYTVQFIYWKQQVLEQQMNSLVTMHLPPTFLDHMIREATEYVSVIDRYLNPAPLSASALIMHSHLLWLPDAMGHAGGIRSKLDLQEFEQYEIASEWVDQFQSLYLHALEMATKVRTRAEKIPSFIRFTRLSADKITVFRKYLLELKELIEEREILSTLHPLMPDHMARESYYYCEKISHLLSEA